MLFMQDNPPIHKAKTVMHWLEQSGVTCLDWPPYSPDLNTIENIWVILKDRINKMHPQLEDMGRTQEACDALARAIVEEWNAIPQEIIDRAIIRMKGRVSDCLHAKGWYTRH